MDSGRTRLEISVIVYRCRACGCLQIKDGGPDVPGVYKPALPGWNPFRTLADEPPCNTHWAGQLVSACVPVAPYAHGCRT